MRPGVNVTTRENAPPSTIPTSLGSGFMIGITEYGPDTPTSVSIVQNMNEYIARYAPTERAFTQGITMYDSAETFFNEGGNRLFVKRVLGDAAAKATGNLMDGAGTPAIALVVTAKSEGAFGNTLDVIVQLPADDATIAAGKFRIKVVDGDAVQLEKSPDLADNTAAISWGSGARYVDVAAGVSLLDPVSQTVSLTGGADDLGSIDNDSWEAAISNIPVELGPGILFAPGVTTTAIHQFMAEAATATYRVAFVDGPNTDEAETLLTAAASVTDAGVRSRFAAMFTPWLLISGITAGSTRLVPPSGAVVGRFSAHIAAGNSANEPAAGENGKLRSVLDVANGFSDVDRVALNEGGVNVIRDLYGTIKVYGWRTVADPVEDREWLSLGNSIMHRQIAALCNQVGERFIFRQIDGQNRLVGEFGGALSGEVCLPLYLAGSLFGDTPDEAYKVDVGPSVNTDATLADNQLRAVVSVKMSPFGEEVNIEIVKYLITDTIPV